MRRCVWLLLLAMASGLAAQVPGDSGMRPDAAERRALREQIRQRWNQHVRTTLGLTPGQATQLQGTEQRYEAQRHPIQARQRDLTQALDAELASGAPNEERVKALMNEREQNRSRLQEIDRSENGEMQRYLTPVQRARYQEERRQFQDKVRRLAQEQRRERQQGRPPRPPPRRRPKR